MPPGAKHPRLNFSLSLYSSFLALLTCAYRTNGIGRTFGIDDSNLQKWAGDQWMTTRLVTECEL